MPRLLMGMERMKSAALLFKLRLDWLISWFRGWVAVMIVIQSMIIVIIIMRNVKLGDFQLDSNIA